MLHRKITNLIDAVSYEDINHADLWVVTANAPALLDAISTPSLPFLSLISPFTSRGAPGGPGEESRKLSSEARRAKPAI